MGRYLGPKAKLCKRVGVNIFGSAKYTKILAKYKQVKRGFKKVSEYSVQLKEKQLARYMYGVSEKQFKRYFNKASRAEGVTGMELLRFLERRIDNVLYRAGFALTRPQARQMISHGHFELNGQRITVPSVMIKVGDIITLRKKMHNSPLYVVVSSLKPAKWIKFDSKKNSIEITRIPQDDELEKVINEQSIVEYYSR